MAKTLDQLPILPQPLAGTDIILVKTIIDGTPLDFKVDINTFLQDYLKTSEVGTEVGDLIRLVDDGAGNAGLPSVSGALLSNIVIPTANDSTSGAVTLSSSTNGTEGVNSGVASTPVAIRNVRLSSLQKAGDTMSGALGFVNNVGLTATKFGGGIFNLAKLDASDNLQIGESGTNIGTINTYVGSSLKIRNSSGTEIFSINVDGSIDGLTATTVGFTPYSFVTATDAQTAIQQVADAALTGGGGDVDGPINFGNGVGISSRNAADTANVSTIYMNSSDRIVVGQTGVNSPDQFRTITTNGVKFFNSAGTEIFSFNVDGSSSGIRSQDVSFSSGNFTSVNVSAALAELESKKFNKTGGSITGDITLNNNTDLNSLSFGGLQTRLLRLNTDDDLIFGEATNQFNNFDITMAGDFLVRNSAGSVIFRLNQNGSSLGFDASDIASTTFAGISSTNVQDAIEELETDKLNKDSGVVSTNLTFPNNVPLRMRKADSSNVEVMKIDASNNLLLGATADRFSNFDIRMDGAFTVRNSAGVSIFSVAQSGAVTGVGASEVSFTPNGNISSVNVQNAIQELDTEKLGATATATNSNLLNGIASSSFARKDIAEEFAENVTIGTNRYLQFGTGSGTYITNLSGDAIFRLGSTTSNLKIRDGSTDRFTFNKATGNLTVTGKTTSNNGFGVPDNVQITLGDANEVSLEFDDNSLGNDYYITRLGANVERMLIRDEVASEAIFDLDRSTGNLIIKGDLTAANFTTSTTLATHHSDAGGGLQLIDEGLDIVNGDINLESSIFVEDTWIKVGPTGSDADYIWTVLDLLPTSAKSISCNARVTVANTGSIDRTWVLYGSSGKLPLEYTANNWLFYAQAPATNGEFIREFMSADIPLNNDNTFYLRKSKSGTGSGNAYLYYRGFRQ